jgi:hypothetical protein
MVKQLVGANLLYLLTQIVSQQNIHLRQYAFVRQASHRQHAPNTIVPRQDHSRLSCNAMHAWSGSPPYALVDR